MDFGLPRPPTADSIDISLVSFARAQNDRGL
jgi:hypothetical protein